MLKLFPRLFLLAATAFAVVLSITPSRPARASSIIPRGQAGCVDGQVVGTRNLVRDGNFAAAYAGNPDFTTELKARDPGIYPTDTEGGGYSIQKGPISYNGGTLIGRPFAGDPAREVPASETYFYSNPYITEDGRQFYIIDGEGLLWGQTVAVTPNTTYNFYAYFDNILRVSSSANDPVIELRVDDKAGDDLPGIAAGPPITVTKVPDTWVPIQYAFTTGITQTQAVLEIWDVTGKSVADPYYGSDFGMVGINLRQCASAIGIAKAVSAPVKNTDGSFNVTYTLTLRNYGGDPVPVSNLQVTDDLARTFANAASFTVTAKSSPTLVVNPNYTGRSPNTGLLAPNHPSNKLAAQTGATITFTVRVTPGSSIQGRGPFYNTAVVTGTASGATIEDDSLPGTNPDPDGNKNPKDNAEDQPTEVSIGAKIALPMVAR